MFDADRPITCSAEDKLNRTVFAKYLARCMLDHQDPDSLVVGLYGGWGVGKTSVINLVLEELNFAASNMADEEKPIILNFSAWSYSGQQELIYSFFRRLSSALRGVTYLENANRIIHLLELYVSFFTRKPVPRSLRTKRNLWEIITFQGREEVYAWESGRDLTLVKAELNELLKAQRHKIIIIIDNISRLYPEEIKQIFQIVKSMGDYANTAYLLAFDKEQVINALNTLDMSGGADFVEKVVQMPFDVPAIQQQDLEGIFAERLNNLMVLVPEDSWDREYWADIYYNSLKYFFLNCRDITRYINTLEFSYSRLKDVVNPVDFFALTAIEVFIPEVYAGIQDNKDLFTDLLDNVYVLNENQAQKDKLRAEEILSRNHRISRDMLLNLLMQLFPRLRRIYFPNIPFYYSDSLARKWRRISSPDLFDAYFRLSLQTGQIQPTEFETILSLAADPVLFDQMITRLNQDERIIKFLDLLSTAVINTIPIEHVQALVTALLDNGDLFPPGIPGELSLDTPMRIHRIIHALLRRFPQSEDRFSVLQNAIAKASKSIYISVYELREQNKEHTEETDTFAPREFRDLIPEQLSSLQLLVVSKIETWAKNDSLVDHPKLLAILYAWRDWGDTEKCKHYIETIIQTQDGLLAFLTQILEKPITQAMTQYIKNPTWFNNITEIDTFIPLTKVTEQAIKLFESDQFEKLREREQLALMIYLDLVKAETKKAIPKTN